MFCGCDEGPQFTPSALIGRLSTGIIFEPEHDLTPDSDMSACASKILEPLPDLSPNGQQGIKAGPDQGNITIMAGIAIVVVASGIAAARAPENKPAKPVKDNTPPKAKRRKRNTSHSGRTRSSDCLGVSRSNVNDHIAARRPQKMNTQSKFRGRSKSPFPKK